MTVTMSATKNGWLWRILADDGCELAHVEFIRRGDTYERSTVGNLQDFLPKPLRSLASAIEGGPQEICAQLGLLMDSP